MDISSYINLGLLSNFNLLGISFYFIMLIINIILMNLSAQIAYNKKKITFLRSIGQYFLFMIFNLFAGIVLLILLTLITSYIII